MEITKSPQTPLTARLEELSGRSEVLDVAEDVCEKGFVGLVVREEAEAQALEDSGEIELDACHLSGVLHFSDVLSQHVLPASQKDVRLNCLREHQIVGLQFTLCVDVRLVELVVLLKPHFALQAPVMPADPHWLADRL